MIKKYTNYINEKNNSKLGNQIMRNYKTVTKLIDSFYLPKLNLNVIPYYNTYQTLFTNTNLYPNEYEICLLIVSSFARLLEDDKTNIDKLENEIRKSNIHELYVSSYNILKTTYSLLRIIKKTHKDTNVVFDNGFILNVIKNYLNNKKIDLYDYNSIFNNGEYLNIINYVNQFGHSTPS